MFAEIVGVCHGDESSHIRTMDAPKFSLVYTTARPNAISGVVDKWQKRAAHPENMRFAVSVDAGNDIAAELARQAVGPENVVINKGPKNCVAGWNIAAKLAEKQGLGDILIAVADDFDVPAAWDLGLTKVAPEGWWKHEFAVRVADGFNPELCTLGIMTARRYKRLGYLFYQDFESIFSDTELTYSAISEKRLIDAKHLLFEHMHPDARKRTADAVDAVHNSEGRKQRGQALFNHRQSLGFPLDLQPAEDLERFALYVQAIQDDFCLYDVVRRIVDEGNVVGVPVARVYLMCPDEWWSGKKRTEAELQQVRAVADKLVAEGVDALLVNLPVAPVRPFFKARIDVETAMRNEAVDRIYADGFAHVLIADGDEFWRRGFYARLVEAIRSNWVGCVYAGLTPVVGYPGYPVEGATDSATVYIAKPYHFVDCRSVAGPRLNIGGHDIIHFTATRRSLEEVVKKHLESGHADDSAYQMEKWAKDVLPNVKPGYIYRWSDTNVGLHMYQPFQIWPSVRAWTPEELGELPACVLSHLGV